MEVRPGLKSRYCQSTWMITVPKKSQFGWSTFSSMNLIGEHSASKVSIQLTGCLAYHSAVLLKIYLYGYLNRIEPSGLCVRQRAMSS